MHKFKFHRADKNTLCNSICFDWLVSHFIIAIISKIRLVKCKHSNFFSPTFILSISEKKAWYHFSMMPLHWFVLWTMKGILNYWLRWGDVNAGLCKFNFWIVSWIFYGSNTLLNLCNNIFKEENCSFLNRT